jgi:hypothetical protein
MSIEEKLRVEMRIAADAMPERFHELPPTLRVAKRSLRVHRVALVGLMATVAVLAFWGVSAITQERTGTTLPPAGPNQRAFSDGEVETAIESFRDAIMGNDLVASWELLTLRARQDLDRETWGREVNELQNELSWIEVDAERLWITKLPRQGSETFLATYTAPPKDGSAFLEVFTLVEEGGELRVDLDRRMEISVLPESPLFMACSVPCDPQEMWPEVRAGQTFSFLLERLEQTFTTTIDHVWFTVGEEGWIAEARLIEQPKAVRAQATFEPSQLTTGENVFTITVETSDGALETYGYRVIHAGE